MAAHPADSEGSGIALKETRAEAGRKVAAKIQIVSGRYTGFVVACEGSCDLVSRRERRRPLREPW